MLVEQLEIKINSSKIEEYLLNLHHPDGWGKAKFFQQHGFTEVDDVKTLLLAIVTKNNIKQVMETGFGTNYIVEGLISTDSTIILRTVWIVLKGETICKFVTAYPL